MRFNDAEAVQFFQKPFLEAFDPELLERRLARVATGPELQSSILAGNAVPPRAAPMG
jgi:hypothetical protein